MTNPGDHHRHQRDTTPVSNEHRSSDARLIKLPAHLLLAADTQNNVQIIDMKEFREKYKSDTLMSGSTEKSLGKGPDTPSDDALLFDTGRGVIGVFDGVGSAVLADKAAQIAGETVANTLDKKDQISSKEAMAAQLQKSLLDAHSTILGIDTVVPEGRERPATTATVAKVFRTHDGEQFVGIASVGDSRAYLYRQQPEGAALVCLTTDQVPTNLSQQQVKERQDRLSNIETVDDLMSLSDSDRMAWRTRNIIGGALGSHVGAEPQIIMQKVFPGDKIIVTTDGVHDNLSTHQIEEIAGQHDTTALAEALVKSSQHEFSNPLSVRKKRDDMTAGVMEVL